MSNPTTPFSWQMPTSTDLVTDLPADFEVFGQAVATSMADLLGGTTGQILSKASNTDMDFTWIANDQGDITAVNVTSPITGGGTSGAVTVGIQSASTSQSGAVQLSDSTSTTSSVLAATPTAVKSAYDVAAAAVPKSTVTAKGSIFTATASATPAELAVGSNGSTLVADSSTSTGLRYQSNFAAGKNAIINGAFNVWQRGTSFSNPSGYTVDRFTLALNGGTPTGTISRQTFTPGTAPVAGYEGAYFFRYNYTALNSANLIILEQLIEDVRTFAGQTVTISFWAKADTTRTVSSLMRQYFGSGGSPSAAVDTASQANSLTTSWQRFSQTVAIPSISGKTIGTNPDSSLQLHLYLPISAGSTIDIWGVQVEAGSVATAFQTATGTIQGELAACQRYLPAFTGPNSAVMGYAYGTNTSLYNIPFPVTARVAPTGVTASGTTNAYALNTATSVTPAFSVSSINNCQVTASHTIIAGQGAQLVIGGTLLFTGCEL